MTALEGPVLPCHQLSCWCLGPLTPGPQAPREGELGAGRSLGPVRGKEVPGVDMSVKSPMRLPRAAKLPYPPCLLSTDVKASSAHVPRQEEEVKAKARGLCKPQSHFCSGRGVGGGGRPGGGCESLLQRTLCLCFPFSRWTDWLPPPCATPPPTPHGGLRFFMPREGKRQVQGHTVRQ